MKPSIHYNNRPIMRRGTGMFELFVSFTLLVTAISVVMPLVVRHGQLLKSHRDYRLALDELSNQLDRLAGLPADDLLAAIERLTPSAFVAERLSGVELAGEVEQAEIGSRITLHLTWNATERRHAPVILAAWIVPTPQPGSEPAGAEP